MIAVNFFFLTFFFFLFFCPNSSWYVVVILKKKNRNYSTRNCLGLKISWPWVLENLAWNLPPANLTTEGVSYHFISRYFMFPLNDWSPSLKETQPSSKKKIMINERKRKLLEGMCFHEIMLISQPSARHTNSHYIPLVTRDVLPQLESSCFLFNLFLFCLFMTFTICRFIISYTVHVHLYARKLCNKSLIHNTIKRLQFMLVKKSRFEGQANTRTN